MPDSEVETVYKRMTAALTWGSISCHATALSRSCA